MSNMKFERNEIEEMFEYETKLIKLGGKDFLQNYKETYFYLYDLLESGELIESEDYCSGNILAENIYKKKYFLKNLNGDLIEKRPEEAFIRIASTIASVEKSKELREKFAKIFYEGFYNGNYLPGGRVIAGAGDLYRLKTLANCFVSVIEKDNLECIFETASQAARTFSYGGGIGIDVSQLRPKSAIVHNASNESTGSVSFMELYSMTTGLIGQAGRRGALMLTLDVKHPDVIDFILAKKDLNWNSDKIMFFMKNSNLFDNKQLKFIEKTTIENTQVRFANISIKVSDEFMAAVEEQNKFGKDKILVYKKFGKKGKILMLDSDEEHYSYGMSQKCLDDYKLVESFELFSDLNEYLKNLDLDSINLDDLNDINFRDYYGDYIIDLENEVYDLAIRFSGDFLTCYKSRVVGEIKRLFKARDIWNLFVEGNYKTAEPGLIFWSNMSKYSQSNYLGEKIACTNPCGEVPLGDGGACNLGSINLSKMVKNGFSDDAFVDWDLLKKSTFELVRLLDNVVSWNKILNPLEKQKKSAEKLREIGLGVMGIADFFYQLGIEYDSLDGQNLLGKIINFITQNAYVCSALIAKEKGSAPIYDFEKYSKNPFFVEILDEDVKDLIKRNGLRNIGIMSIAPNNGLSNIVPSFSLNGKNYIGVSSGIEPVFALFYTRRTESFGENKTFNVFHSTAQVYIDMFGLNDKVENINDEKELRNFLPNFFFRSAHYIDPIARVKIQGIAQKYIDHSISSTVNLPEDISPEVISEIYLKAWKNGLKGITIYRDGSRFPILAVSCEKTSFQMFADKEFRIKDGVDEKIITGDEVLLKKDGTLSTVYHENYFKKYN